MQAALDFAEDTSAWRLVQEGIELAIAFETMSEIPTVQAIREGALLAGEVAEKVVLAVIAWETVGRIDAIEALLKLAILA